MLNHKHQPLLSIEEILQRAANLRPVPSQPSAPGKSADCPYCHDRGVIEYLNLSDGTTIQLAADQPAGLESYRYPEARIAMATCTCQARATAYNRLKGLLDNGGVPKRYHGFSFTSWDALPESAQRGKVEMREACEYFAATDSTGQNKCGLVLSGSPGIGKTGLASCVLLERARRGQVVLWLDFANFMRQVRDTYQANSKTTYEQTVGAASTAPFLFLDDMGDMARAKDISDNTRDVMYDVIGSRYNDMRELLITTNLSFAAYRDQFGARIELENR